MDRDGLVEMVESFTKRADLTTEIETYFIPLCEARIGRDLKSDENLAVDDSSYAGASSSPLALPDDFGAIFALEYQAGGGPVTLTSMNRHAINKWKQSGGTPARYSIGGNGIEVRPFASGDYVLSYYSRPSLTDGTS